MRRNCVLFCFSVLFVWVTVASPYEKSDYRYDYWYVEPARGWLKLHVVPATFREAFLRCKLEGAVLASPLDENLQEAMEMMKDAWKVDSSIFTGIHATISKGDFTSIEGIPLSKIPVTWDHNEPNNFEDKEDCIIMRQNGTVADANCNGTHPYVCYRKKTTSPELTDCGTVDTGYSLDQRTGSCYKFHNHGRTWRRGQMTCVAEGGHLAIINSDIEATVMKELFNKHPSSTISSSYPDSVALGFLDWDKKGSWYTVNGQSLEEAGYAKWESGSPNNRQYHSIGQYCGGMYRSARLDDLWCDLVKLAFICEKSPDSLLTTDEKANYL